MNLPISDFHTWNSFKHTNDGSTQFQPIPPTVFLCVIEVGFSVSVAFSDPGFVRMAIILLLESNLGRPASFLSRTSGSLSIAFAAVIRKSVRVTPSTADTSGKRIVRTPC